MEINEALIKKAAEHVMLNSCSVSSSGLFNGKAGMSLALFEVARFLEDEYIEDQALQTLQESLLTKTNDPGFENGLSGIGYVLLYLTKNKLVEADFDELFGDKLQFIYEHADKLCDDFITNGVLPMCDMRMIYFLDIYHKCVDSDRSSELKEKLLTVYCEKLRNLLSDTLREKEGVSKIDYMLYLEEFIKMADKCCNCVLPSVLVDSYISEYEDGRWMSRVLLSNSLYVMSEKAGNQRWKDSALCQADIALQSVDVRVETLRTMTDILFCNLPLKSYQEKSDEIRNHLFTTDGQKLTQNLSRAISHKNMSAGYASGMSRLLLCAVNEYTGRKRNEVLRPL